MFICLKISSILWYSFFLSDLNTHCSAFQFGYLSDNLPKFKERLKILLEVHNGRAWIENFLVLEDLEWTWIVCTVLLSDPALRQSVVSKNHNPNQLTLTHNSLSRNILKSPFILLYFNNFLLISIKLIENKEKFIHNTGFSAKMR